MVMTATGLFYGFRGNGPYLWIPIIFLISNALHNSFHKPQLSNAISTNAVWSVKWLSCGLVHKRRFFTATFLKFFFLNWMKTPFLFFRFLVDNITKTVWGTIFFVEVFFYWFNASSTIISILKVNVFRINSFSKKYILREIYIINIQPSHVPLLQDWTIVFSDLEGLSKWKRSIFRTTLLISPLVLGWYLFF